MADIAERLNVSRATVSLALRDSSQVGEARRKHIQAVAAELGYKPNVTARALRTQKSQTVGLLVPNLATAATNAKAEAVQHALMQHNYQVLLGRTQLEVELSLSSIDEMAFRNVDGLIVLSHLDHPMIHRRLEQLGLPTVMVDVPQRSRASHMAFVQVDRAHGCMLAAEHLSRVGLRDIAFLAKGIERWGTMSSLKWRGLVEASKTTDLRIRFMSLDGQVSEMHQVETDSPGPLEKRRVRPVSHRRDERRAWRLGRMLAASSDRPDAVLASNDLLAMATIRGLVHGGARVPEDVSVVGFDDSPMSRLFLPALTTLRQPVRALARHSVQMLLSMLRDDRLPAQKRRVTLKPRLVVRESTA